MRLGWEVISLLPGSGLPLIGTPLTFTTQAVMKSWPHLWGYTGYVATMIEMLQFKSSFGHPPTLIIIMIVFLLASRMSQFWWKRTQEFSLRFVLFVLPFVWLSGPFLWGLAVFTDITETRLLFFFNENTLLFAGHPQLSWRHFKQDIADFSSLMPILFKALHWSTLNLMVDGRKYQEIFNRMHLFYCAYSPKSASKFKSSATFPAA